MRNVKRTAALLLSIMLLTSSALADTFTPYTSSSIDLRADASASDTLHITTIAPYDGDRLVTEPDNPTLAESAADLFDHLAIGEIGAAKNVDPASVKDGIVRIDLDAAYHSQPLDLLLVLDRSGSMNMWVKDNDAKSYSYIYTPDPNRNPYVSPHNTPCMNPDHYYLINYTIVGQTGNHTYKFHPTHSSGNVTSWLSALDNKNNPNSDEHADMSPLEQMIEATIGGAEIIITSIGNHYNGSDVLIPEDLTGVIATDHHGFTSPAADLVNGYKTVAGCFDRSMLARHMLWQFITRVIEANPENRVGYTAFAGTVETQYVVPYTNNLNTLRTAILGDRGGDQHTNYKAAFDSAAQIFQNAATNSKKVVVFVSDGNPSPDSGSIKIDGIDVAFSDGSQEAAVLKAQGAEIYAVGVNSGAIEALKMVATDSAHASDCSTAAELIAHLTGVMDMVVDNKVLVTDTLGEYYDLLVSSEYPVTITDGKTGSVTTVTSVDDLANHGVIYDAAKRTISYTVAATKSGVRLSFFAQLAAEKRIPAAAGTVTYPTNTSMSYTPVVNDVPQLDDTVYIDVDDSLRVTHTSVTAVKDNGKMANRRVVKGTAITYTITVRNTNGFDLTDLVITDKLPEGTRYVEGSGGKYDEETGIITFRADRIRAGGTKKFTFQVKVEKGVDPVVNTAQFSVAEITDDSGSRLIGNTNEVVNPRNPDIPQTGDGAHPAAWLAILLTAAVCIAFLRRRQMA